MIDKLMKLKKEGTLSPVEKDAKMSVLEEMRKMAEGAMGDKLKGLKKVTVASNDPTGLAVGLDKAKAMVGGGDDAAADMGAGEDGDAGPMHSSMVDSDEDGSDLDHMSEDEIDAKLQELMALKEKKKSKMDLSGI